MREVMILIILKADYGSIFSPILIS